MRKGGGMRSLVLLVPLVLAGCGGSMEPFNQPYTWHKTGVNDQNLAAMVANPADLQRGRQDQDPDSPVVTDAVTRLWSGKPKPLPANRSTEKSSGTSNATGGAGAASATGSGS